MQINQLALVDVINGGDQLVIWSPMQGDTRRTSITALLEYIQENITTDDSFITQYEAPSATAFSVEVEAGENGTQNAWLVLTPTGTFANGEIVLPAASGSEHHGQEIVVNCTQIVTTLAVDGNGATVTGAPTTLAANAFFRLRFDGVTNTWYRIG